MEVMDVVRNDDWEAGEFDGEAAKSARWLCRTACWECRSRYFCRLKARSGDIWRELSWMDIFAVLIGYFERCDKSWARCDDVMKV
jgi:hypothetical protein